MSRPRAKRLCTICHKPMSPWEKKTYHPACGNPIYQHRRAERQGGHGDGLECKYCQHMNWCQTVVLRGMGDGMAPVRLACETQ